MSAATSSTVASGATVARRPGARGSRRPSSPPAPARTGRRGPRRSRGERRILLVRAGDGEPQHLRARQHRHGRRIVHDDQARQPVHDHEPYGPGHRVVRSNRRQVHGDIACLHGIIPLDTGCDCRSSSFPDQFIGDLGDLYVVRRASCRLLTSTVIREIRMVTPVSVSGSPQTIGADTHIGGCSRMDKPRGGRSRW